MVKAVGRGCRLPGSIAAAIAAYLAVAMGLGTLHPGTAYECLAICLGAILLASYIAGRIEVPVEPPDGFARSVPIWSSCARGMRWLRLVVHRLAFIEEVGRASPIPAGAGAEQVEHRQGDGAAHRRGRAPARGARRRIAGFRRRWPRSTGGSRADQLRDRMGSPTRRNPSRFLCPSRWQTGLCRIALDADFEPDFALTPNRRQTASACQADSPKTLRAARRVPHLLRNAPTRARPFEDPLSLAVAQSQARPVSLHDRIRSNDSLQWPLASE